MSFSRTFNGNEIRQTIRRFIMQVVQGAILSVGFLFLMVTGTSTETYIAEPTPVVKEVNPCDVSVEACITKYFPEDPQLAIAVFKAESSLNPNNIGYNCRYEYFNKKTQATSTKVTTCKVADRANAISKDYGIAQINDQHSKTPEMFLDPETNLRKARELYDERGWKCWYAYTDGKYKQYL